LSLEVLEKYIDKSRIGGNDKDKKTGYKNAFEQADKDGDTFVTREEVKNLPTNSPDVKVNGLSIDSAVEALLYFYKNAVDWDANREDAKETETKPPSTNNQNVSTAKTNRSETVNPSLNRQPGVILSIKDINQRPTEKIKGTVEV